MEEQFKQLEEYNKDLIDLLLNNEITLDQFKEKYIKLDLICVF